jgi:flagellar hook protein FlgE
MSFPLSLTGLLGAARALDVIGNNIANSQTVGFKSSKAQFQDIFTSTLSRGSMPHATAEGASANKIQHSFIQGGIQATSNALDVAISGSGFFRLQDGKDISYTRDGQFMTSLNTADSKVINLVNRDQVAVTGYAMDYATNPQGVAVPSNPPVPLSFQIFMPGQPSENVAVSTNLDARLTAPTQSPFDPNDPTTFNYSESIPIYGDGQPQSLDEFSVGTYDSKLYKHTLNVYWSRSSDPVTPNSWTVNTSLTSYDPATKKQSTQAGTTTGTLAFDTQGQLTSGAALPSTTFTLPDDRVVGPLSVDFSGSTQYGADSQTFNISTGDSYLGGVVDVTNGIYVENNGEIWGNYSNGQSRRVGQLILSNFVNVDALIQTGNGQWMRNSDPVSGTGAESFGYPGGGNGKDSLGMGRVTGGAVEVSNVDLNAALVGLIEQQRYYQANAQTFKIQDEVLQNLVNTIR